MRTRLAPALVIAQIPQAGKYSRSPGIDPGPEESAGGDERPFPRHHLLQKPRWHVEVRTRQARVDVLDFQACVGREQLEPARIQRMIGNERFVCRQGRRDGDSVLNDDADGRLDLGAVDVDVSLNPRVLGRAAVRLFRRGCNRCS